MKSLLTSLLLFFTAGTTAASAFLGSNDGAPGATLLVPYFEVDLADPNGPNTVFRVANATVGHHIAHVVLWTDWGIPTFGFEIELFGNASVDINMREVFSGHLSGTPTILIVAVTNYPVFGPACSPPFLLLDEIDHIAAAHTGMPSQSFGNECAGANHGDDVARGFITVDILDDCTDLLPHDSGYFEQDGDLGFDNALWGTVAWTNRGNGSSAGATLPALESGIIFGGTFYGTFADTGGDDRREPLPPLWYGGFFNDGDRSSDVVLWREPTGVVSPVTCGFEPPQIPLQQGLVTLRSPQGVESDVSNFDPFPYAANRVAVDSANLPVPSFDVGQIRFAPQLFLPGAATSGAIFADVPQAAMLLIHDLGNGQAAGVSAASDFFLFEK